jgi:FkbM family methyltransferase
MAAPFEKSLVLVGAGTLGRQILACLRRDVIEPLAFADNNPALQGKFIEGVQVLSRQQAAEKYGNLAAFVVTIWNTDHSFVQTYKELTALNCKKVVSAVTMRWKYPEALLPFFWLDKPSKTCAKADLIRAVFPLWADDFSRHEFLAQLKFRILGEFDSLSAPVPQESYFPDDIFDFHPDEAFVDCGAFDGITIKHFLKRQPSFDGQIAAYEPDPINLQHLKQYISSLENSLSKKIVVLPNAVGEKREKVHFDATGTMGSNISAKGLLEVDCVTLDESLKEHQFHPTYIKMDIEGSESEALLGARNIIKNNSPILAICLYHRYDDLWRIPLLIKEISNKYSIFLRPHEIEGWQIVCYAVPKERLKTQND